jgi:hypothetical protein
MTGCKTMYRWWISRIRGTAAEFVGYVEAPALAISRRDALVFA